MPTVTSFDTDTIRPWYNPQPDTFDTVSFPRSYVAPPRLPHGLRHLGMDHRWNIRVMTPIENIQRDSAIYHISSWNDTELNRGVVDSLILAPANLDIMCGEHKRDSNSPCDVRIVFERPFITPPKVVVFFNAFDLDRSENWRLKTTATNVDKWGFTLNISTWSDTIFYSAQVGWIAYPEDREHIFSTSVSTNDIRPYYNPQLQHSKDISFGNVEFFKHPAVFVALNQFDIDSKAQFRIDAYGDNVSTKGLTWHINTWDDTVLYSAGATIIAVN